MSKKLHLGSLCVEDLKRKLMNKRRKTAPHLSSSKDSKWKMARQKSHMAQKNSLRYTESIAGLLDGSKNEHWTRPVHWFLWITA